jgi:ATP-dependent DNA helicase RecQ
MVSARSAMPAIDTQDLDAVLQERFGLSEFRPWQKEAIVALLGSPGRVLVVAPTGGGKSLTYQLPAAVLPGTTLVLSPLVALMEDQVRSLTARGISATFLASTLEPAERRLRESRFARGEYKLVYAAPERLGSGAFVDLLARCSISLVAVDEAHCISHWGHDFRPDYLRIGALIGKLAPPRILACTATATPDVRAEIKAQLGLEGRCVEVLRGFARPNLHLSAHAVAGRKEAERVLGETLKNAIGVPGSRRKGTSREEGAKAGGAIVYAATRRSTEHWAAWLGERGYRAAVYHAGIDAETRTRVANDFSSRAVDVVVATNAFGMGIDRSDIRAVVHVQPPASIEAYYQEVGRAGRDGAEAYGVLLCAGTDIALRRRLVETGRDGESQDPALSARAWGLFRELLRYIDARTCRHDFVLRYFGDEQELLGDCGHCDVCETIDSLGRDPDKKDEDPALATLVVRKALSGVARAHGRSGLASIAEMLRGVDNPRTRRLGFTSLSTFGLFSTHSNDWLVALLRALLAAGWIDLTAGDYPVVVLTRTGSAAMRGDGPIRFVLPATPSKTRARSDEPVRAASPAVGALDEDEKRLFERLRDHRAEVARQKRVPAYVVALDRTLVELARVRPRSPHDLMSIYGMGPARVEQYGMGFLAVLATGPG